MSRRVGASKTWQVCKLIEARRDGFSVQAICRVLDVAANGYYG